MCLICDRIEMIKNGTNPYFVKELKTGYVVLGDHQRFEGYTLFLYKRHITELFMLDPDEKAEFLREMSLVAEAVHNAFKPEKLNYEMLGMGDSHMHWHLFPRRSGDIGKSFNNGKGPVWCLPMQELYDDKYRPSAARLEEMKSKLLAELNKLI